jgi:hypothetical protein
MEYDASAEAIQDVNLPEQLVTANRLSDEENFQQRFAECGGSDSDLDEYFNVIEMALDHGPQGHDYRQLTQVCRRPLSAAERRDLVSRFTVPGALWFGAKGVDGPGLHFVTWYGAPGGVVDTFYSTDGFTGTNVTTWAHIFQGQVDRSAVNIGGHGYMTTHGFRTGPIHDLPVSIGPIPSFVGTRLDVYNQEKAPEIFSAYDERAREYAQEKFDGC